MYKNKQKLFYWIKCSFGHGIGNMISALIGIFESLLLLISFGHLSSRLQMKWIIFRMGNKWFK